MQGMGYAKGSHKKKSTIGCHKQWHGNGGNKHQIRAEGVGMKGGNDKRTKILKGLLCGVSAAAGMSAIRAALRKHAVCFGSAEHAGDGLQDASAFGRSNRDGIAQILCSSNSSMTRMLVDGVDGICALGTKTQHFALLQARCDDMLIRSFLQAT